MSLVLAQDERMKVQLLHIEDCPNRQEAKVAIREVLDELGLQTVSIEYRLLTDRHDLLDSGFAGSPTVLIDGRDAIPGTTPIDELACRMYASPGGLTPSPTRHQIRDAILRARRFPGPTD